MTDQIKSLLNIGYSAGGDAELARQLAKGMRIKGKYVAFIETIKADCLEIWRALCCNSYYRNLCICKVGDIWLGKGNPLIEAEPMGYIIDCIVNNKPVLFHLQPASIHYEMAYSTVFNVAKKTSKALKNRLKTFSLQLQYFSESEYFLISASNTSNI